MEHQPTRAEQTTAILQAAARGGSALMIPGAFESRVRAGSSQAVAAAGPAVPFERPALFPRERLEQERAGGGAPSERRGPTDGLFRKMGNWLFRRGLAVVDPATVQLGTAGKAPAKL